MGLTWCVHMGYADQVRALSEDDEETTVVRFMEYLRAQDAGFDGSYEEWHWEVYRAEAVTAAIRRLNRPKPEPEQVVQVGRLSLQLSKRSLSRVSALLFPGFVAC